MVARWAFVVFLCSVDPGCGTVGVLFGNVGALCGCRLYMYSPCHDSNLRVWEANGGLSVLLNEDHRDSFNEANNGCTSDAIVRVHAESDSAGVALRIGRVDAHRPLTA